MNITVDRKVIEQALAVLENPMYGDFYEWTLALKDARDALRTALGQQYMTNAAGELEPVTIIQTGVGIGKQKPVAWMLKSGHGTEFNDCIAEELKALTWKGKPMWTPLYVSPPQRKPLTDEEIAYAVREISFPSIIAIARAVEAAHGIKGEA